MNTVIISGRLTADVELRFTTSGTPIGQFNLACNRKWKDQSGELKEKCSFFGVTVFGKQAETVAQYFKKGHPILVQGRLEQETWDDKKTGEKRSKTLVVMEQFEFMQGRSDQPGEPTKPLMVKSTDGQTGNLPVEEDAVPF